MGKGKLPVDFRCIREFVDSPDVWFISIDLKGSTRLQAIEAEAALSSKRGRWVTLGSTFPTRALIVSSARSGDRDFVDAVLEAAKSLFNLNRVSR